MEILYLILLMAIMIVLFAVFKRPMPEVMFVSFLILAIVTGHTGNIATYIINGAGNYLLFMVMAFMAFSTILEKTGITSDFTNVITALVGRFSGGAGYVALISSAMFGALSGTGPGNAAAIGAVAIPAMKKTGFSAELAASIEMAASALGPVIPPSGTVALSFAVLVSVYPDCCTFSQFWLLMWGISLLIILEQLIVLFILIKKHKVKSIPKELRPDFGDSIKKGWKALLLPVVVFAPVLMDAMLSDTFISSRLGAEGASTFTNCLLLMVPSICAVYALIVNYSNGNKMPIKKLARLFEGAVSDIAPLIFMILGGYALSGLFNDLGIGASIAEMFAGKTIPLWAFAVLVPLIFGILGAFLDSISVIYMFQIPVMAIAVTAGMNPIFIAAMMSVMTVALGHMTPPFAPTLYVSMGIAESDFGKTTKLAFIWAGAHYVITVLLLLGIIPILGMIPFTP